MASLLRKYGVQTDIYFVIPDAGTTDLAQSAAWTPATGDTKISKNGGTLANTTNNPAIVAGTNGVWWKLTLTATEMQAAQVMVQIVDSATKAVEDQAILIETYGNASGLHEFDLDLATQNVAVTSIAANAITASAIATDAIGAAELAADAVSEIAAAITSGATAEEIATEVLTQAMVESYAADGAAPTLTQAILAIHQWLHDKDAVGTVITVYELDGTTVAYTLAVDDAQEPTLIHRDS